MTVTRAGGGPGGWGRGEREEGRREWEEREARAGEGWRRGGEEGGGKRSREVKQRPGAEEREGQEEAGEEKEQGGSLSLATGILNGAEMIFKSILHQVGEREGQSMWSCLKSTLLRAVTPSQALCLYPRAGLSFPPTES